MAVGFSGGGALSGATTGAALGTGYGGPGIGTAIGAGVGLLAGGFLGGGKKQKGFNARDIQNLLDQRARQISEFQVSLAGARQRLLDRVGAFQQAAFKRFLPEAEAQFAGRGLQVSGGAFGSELARRAASAEENLALQAAQLEREDLLAAEQLRGQAFGAGFGAQTELGMFQSRLAAQPDELSQSLGALAGAALPELISGIRARGLQSRSVVPTGSSPLSLSQLQASRFDPNTRLSRGRFDLPFMGAR